jgi:hypothetical protein
VREESIWVVSSEECERGRWGESIRGHQWSKHQWTQCLYGSVCLGFVTDI